MTLSLSWSAGSSWATIGGTRLLQSRVGLLKGKHPIFFFAQKTTAQFDSPPTPLEASRVNNALLLAIRVDILEKSSVTSGNGIEWSPIRSVIYMSDKQVWMK